MLQLSPKYDQSIHKKLAKVNWDNILPSVYKYARARAVKLSWLGDKVAPETLVNEAIARAYGIGTNGAYRNWNSEKCPKIENFLIGIIKSMTSHIAEHEADFPKIPIFQGNDSEQDTKIFQTGVETIGFINPRTPEDKLLEAEKFQSIMDKLLRLSEEDVDLGMVITCLEDGISKPREIAKATGYDTKTVNNLLRKLRRRLDQFNPKMKENLPKKGGKNGN